MSEDAARPEATGATLASSTIGMRQEPSRLRWHFYSNLLLSLMREGLDVKSLPDSIDKSYLQGLMASFRRSSTLLHAGATIVSRVTKFGSLYLLNRVQERRESFG